MISPAIITIQVGQCGNQVGVEFYETVFQDACTTSVKKSSCSFINRSYANESLEKFFRRGENGCYVARSVLIDTEPKVVEQLVSTKLTSTLRKNHDCSTRVPVGWQYDNNGRLNKLKGSGNNWALGYAVHGVQCGDLVINLVDREVSFASGLIEAFIVLMSPAGGTGSGLGCKIVEKLRLAFPDEVTVACIVWPFSSGDVVTQSLNSTLTFSHLVSRSNDYVSADAVIVFENDALLDVAKKLHTESVGFDHINVLIAHMLASLLQPICFDIKCYDRRPVSILDVIEHMRVNKSFSPVFSVDSVPLYYSFTGSFMNSAWQTLFKQLNSRPNIGRKIMFRRGLESDEKMTPRQRLSQDNSIIDKAIAQTERNFLTFDKTVVSIILRKEFINSLNRMLTRSIQMIAAGAFLHHYQKFGVSESDIVSSVNIVKQFLETISRLE